MHNDTWHSREKIHSACQSNPFWARLLLSIQGGGTHRDAGAHVVNICMLQAALQAQGWDERERGVWFLTLADRPNNQNEALPTSPPIHLSRSPIFLLLSNFLKCQVRFLCYFASIPCWKDLHMSCLDAWGMLMFPAGYLKFQMKTLSLWVQRCTHPCVVQNLYDSSGTQKWEISKNILVCAFAINGDWGFLVSKPCKKKSGPQDLCTILQVFWG